jgi:hypothetical protein
MNIKIIIALLLSVSSTRGASGWNCPETGYFKGTTIDMINPDTVITNQPVRVELFRMNLLPPSTGVRYYRNGIIYQASSKQGKKMIPDHLSFGKVDAFQADLKDTILQNQATFSPSSSFPYPCEGVTFSTDYNTMYFTKYSDSDGVEKIHEARYSPGEGGKGNWTIDESPLSFCTGQFAYSHPALSADGRIMIFASNRPGSLGGMDLFITQNKDGKWSDPENIGDAVNSRANEMYPFVDPENNLFFSSDGILGYGGYDIFACKFTGKTWEKPINIATPVNTIHDDIAFVLNPEDGRSAFYTVRQKSVKIPLQLYRVVLDKTLVDEKTTTLSRYFTNPSTSQFIFIVKEPPVEATSIREEAERAKASGQRGKNDAVVYRVQFLTSFNPKTRTMVTLNGKDHPIFEYLYSGAYRLCTGEFNNVAQAKELQDILIRNDYSQASIVPFRNNVRSFEPELLKEIAAYELLPATGSPAAVNPTVALEEVKAPETVRTEPPNKMAQVPAVDTTAKKLTVKTPPPPPPPEKDIITYRVQIISDKTSKGSISISIANRNYKTFEYFFNGMYRTCVGDFSTLPPAKDLQDNCRKSGYPQAFVVAFRNNVRSTDPALFK